MIQEKVCMCYSKMAYEELELELANISDLIKYTKNKIFFKYIFLTFLFLLLFCTLPCGTLII